MPQPAQPTWIQSAIRDHQQALLRQAWRLLGDMEAARDVVQETFLRLCRAEKARVEDHLAAWLATVCRNLALDELRKEMRMQTLNAAGLLDDAVVPQAPPDPARLAEGSSLVQDLGAALGLLTANQREVMRLRFQGGLSYQEIGQVTGLSVSNVGVQLHTALLRLRRSLGPATQAATTSDATATLDAPAAPDAGERSR